MNLPSTFTHSPVPLTLYHYTSQDGLLGILRHNILWATDIRYLNDSSEHQYGKDLVEHTIENRKLIDPLNAAFYDGLIGATDLLTVFKHFVISLSEEKDLLSQWHGYTPIGSGFNIGLDGSILAQNVRGSLNSTFVKCLYQPPEQINEINNLLNDTLYYYKGHHFPEEYLKARKSEFSSLSLAFKHPAFAAENEWRLVVSMPEYVPLEFRTGHSMLTPYLSVTPLKHKDVEQEDGTKKREYMGQLPVREVVVGPTPHPELSKQSVEAFLNSLAINAKVENSTISFRGW